MKLVAVVRGADTDPQVVSFIARFGSETLGKGIVFGKDTPTFVANRIGVFAMMTLIRLALEQGFTVEEVDTIFGVPMARPKSAVFRTADVVGLDTIVEVAHHCYAHLVQDERREAFKVPAVLEEMVRRKMLGDKTGGGFIRKTASGMQVLGLHTLSYPPPQAARFASVATTHSPS